MPKHPPHKCNVFTCRNLTNSKFCEEHKDREQPFRVKPTLSAAKRGYDKTWQKARVRYLREHPFCAECSRRGQKTPATIVDHIIDHKMNMLAFWNEDNWQPLCAKCHTRKTARDAALGVGESQS